MVYTMLRMLPLLSFLLLLMPAVVSAAAFAHVYTASNEPTGNSVLISAVSSTGELSFVTAVSTSGLGSSITGRDDTLYSSNSVVVDSVHALLFVVNAGSDSVSLFSISPAQPASLTLLDTQPSGFQYPVSIAVSAAHSVACVVNSGAANGIRCFDYSAGSLTVIAAWDRNLDLGPDLTTPPNGPFNGTGDIVFTPDGRSLVVGVRLNLQGFLYFFPIDWSSNTLADAPVIVVPDNSKAPYSLSFLSDDSLLVTDPVLLGVSLLHFNSTDGTSDDAGSVPAFNVTTPTGPGVGALCWSTYSPATGSWYLIGSADSGNITEIAVDPVTLQATLRGVHAAVPGSGALDSVVISLNSTTDILLVLGSVGHDLQAFAIPAAGLLVNYQTSPLPALTAGSLTVQGLDYFLTPQASPPSVLGDPSFVGLRGQQYQVHGLDGEVYALISAPRLQVNAVFTFLASGSCPVIHGVADTNCWSHPGSYLGAIGLQYREGAGEAQLHQLTIRAGDRLHGFATVMLDGKDMVLGGRAEAADQSFTVHWTSSHRLEVRTDSLHLVFSNSDRFINQQLAPLVPLSSLAEQGMHGLLGQTHSSSTYASAVRHIAGDVDDYIVPGRDLFGVSALYNRFGTAVATREEAEAVLRSHTK